MESDDLIASYGAYVNGTIKVKSHRRTPYIISLREGELTSIDIRAFLENGLKIIRFRITRTSNETRAKILNMVDDAVEWCCKKYETTSWPLAVSLDIPNACILTGSICDGVMESEVRIEEDTIIEITSRTEFWDQCDSSRIFIDDPYILKEITPGTEITIRFGLIVMACTEVVDGETIKCKVLRGDNMGRNEFVCVRGVKHLKPMLSKIDRGIIELAKVHKVAAITVNFVRKGSTLKRIKEQFRGCKMPLIISSICEQEGLDNIDDIIANSDIIILAREYLAHEIVDRYKMTSIQLQISAKCREVGIPFYISGDILGETIEKGFISAGDIADVTTAIQQGAGFVIRNFTDSIRVLKMMQLMNEYCAMIETISPSNDMWRRIEKYKMPVNAAEACILASAVTASKSKSMAFVVLTVSGRTAIQLSHVAPNATILTVSTDADVANRMHFYTGIIPVLYDKKPLRDWQREMECRIAFALNHGLKQKILVYGDSYVVLRKSTPSSAYADMMSVARFPTLGQRNEEDIENQ